MYSAPSPLSVKSNRKNTPHKKQHKPKEASFLEAFGEVGISNEVTMTVKDVIKFRV